MTSGRSVEPLLGRAAELARLRALLDDALSGRPRVVIVSGEPGIGRTALLRRFTDEAARAGACVLWPRSFGSPDTRRPSGRPENAHLTVTAPIVEQ